MSVLITGANGFIGKNLQIRLREELIEYETFTRSDSLSSLKEKVTRAKFIVHLAGVNRPEDDAEFLEGNTNLSRRLAELAKECGNQCPIIFSSSIQAGRNNPYGDSKRMAEDAFDALAESNGNTILNYRLPNVFGKWCKPNYNSAIATFCFNIAHDLPINIHDPDHVVNLVYVDDVVNEFIKVIKSYNVDQGEVRLGVRVEPVYQAKVGELAELLYSFKQSRETHITERVGTGLVRALYSTYISYYEPEQFSYSLKKHEDPRGVFVEMLKTKDSGQISFFTAHPGVTRGGHYHHSKNEKFLVIQGTAKFKFRNIHTDETYELITQGDEPRVVETVPGWSHDITNIGKEDMRVLLWANEIFDPEMPDTIAHKV
ncbi:NAD-dependent epimerase/dehydratase family protein [Pseudoalteromonas sp. OOF1S-7]|uniref:UDP-2-acetamido-2,6-beta-L-arabino-hexul-4-ose reductase n=1 Tax=Pseudoalteromonas sp. OOF1S-7 TaxID=2917757 RepID=UPI001EF3E4C3|nr:NAD-dependent epimerase/dehydratase family protein [Pseudoalteromonas sp. OOF1S-7]MCG7536338.1 NAD-dependent epimerase/dehydratase family protein [Pseudoalteromonas sp. OOF1S-7]